MIFLLEYVFLTDSYLEMYIRNVYKMSIPNSQEKDIIKTKHRSAL